MNNKEAITIVAQALEIANKAGAFELKDAAVINEGLITVIKLVQSLQPTEGHLNGKVTSNDSKALKVKKAK